MQHCQVASLILCTKKQGLSQTSALLTIRKVCQLPDESTTLEIFDIRTDDLRNIFTLETTDGSLFEIKCRKIK